GVTLGGTPTFSFFPNGTCTAPATGTSSALALSSGAVDATGFAQGPLSAGSYSFQATYSGDSNYNGSTAPCETVTVNKANTTAATAIHNGPNRTVDVQGTTLALRSTIHDFPYTTLVRSGVTLGGTPTFSFFPNGTCTAPATGTSSALTLSSGAV